MDAKKKCSASFNFREKWLLRTSLWRLPSCVILLECLCSVFSLAFWRYRKHALLLMWLLIVKRSRFAVESDQFWQAFVISILIYTLSLYQMNLGPGRLCSFTIRADSCGLVIGQFWFISCWFTPCHCILVIRILQLSTVAWKRSTGHKLTCILFLKIPPPPFISYHFSHFLFFMADLTEDFRSHLSVYEV